MGWDAFSSAKVKYSALPAKLTDPILEKAFTNASRYVKRKTGTADGLLRLGGLDVSTCGEMLEAATGQKVWVEHDWPSAVVKWIWKISEWDFEYDKEEEWAYWSAYYFLKTCAKHGLSIRFSY